MSTNDELLLHPRTQYSLKVQDNVNNMQSGQWKLCRRSHTDLEAKLPSNNKGFSRNRNASASPCEVRNANRFVVTIEKNLLVSFYLKLVSPLIASQAEVNLLYPGVNLLEKL